MQNSSEPKTDCSRHAGDATSATEDRSPSTLSSKSVPLDSQDPSNTQELFQGPNDGVEDFLADTPTPLSFGSLQELWQDREDEDEDEEECCPLKSPTPLSFASLQKLWQELEDNVKSYSSDTPAPINFGDLQQRDDGKVRSYSRTPTTLSFGGLQ